MDESDKLRAKQIIEQLKSSNMMNIPNQGQVQNPQQGHPQNFYVPDPNAVDNQGSEQGVETKEIPGIGVVFKDANVSTNLNPQPSKQVVNEIKSDSFPGGGNVCPECGKMHPPLPQGKKCPMAPIKIKTETGEEVVVDLNWYLDKFRDIFKIQLEQRNVKDPDHFMKYVIVELTKIIEKYKGPE